MPLAAEHGGGAEEPLHHHQCPRDFLRPVHRVVQEIAVDLRHEDDHDVYRENEPGKILERVQQAGQRAPGATRVAERHGVRAGAMAHATAFGFSESMAALGVTSIHASILGRAIRCAQPRWRRTTALWWGVPL